MLIMIMVSSKTSGIKDGGRCRDVGLSDDDDEFSIFRFHTRLFMMFVKVMNAHYIGVGFNDYD